MVVSEPGEGTRFEVRLPLYIPKLNRAGNADAAATALLVARSSEDKAHAPDEMY